MKKLIFPVVISVTFLMTSCFVGEPLTSRSSDNNRTYTVDYLFEHDGCKVYRFFDNGRYVYFTNRTSDITAIQTDSTVVTTKSTVIK